LDVLEKEKKLSRPVVAKHIQDYARIFRKRIEAGNFISVDSKNLFEEMDKW